MNLSSPYSEILHLLCDKNSLDGLLFKKKKVTSIQSDVPDEILDFFLPSGLQQHFSPEAWTYVEKKSKSYMGGTYMTNRPSL